MRIESFGRFNPLCQSRLVVMNRHTIPHPTGLICKPCLKVTPPLPCQCCLEFEISGVGDTIYSPGHPAYEFTHQFCLHANQIVTLAPSPSTELEQPLICIWYETQESIERRTGTPSAFAFSAVWNTATFGFRIGFGGVLSTWEAALYSGPCREAPFSASWTVHEDIREKPFPTCLGEENLTIQVDVARCSRCETGLCLYTNYWDGTVHDSWRLKQSNCRRRRCDSDTCACMSAEEFEAREGPPPSVTQEFVLHASCRCEEE